MKNRAAALQKLAEGLDEIVASHAEKMAKGPVETSTEHHDEYEVKAEMPGMEEAEEAEEGEEGEEASPGVKGEISMEETSPMPEAEAEGEDEMEAAKRDIAARLAKKPVAIRRG